MAKYGAKERQKITQNTVEFLEEALAKKYGDIFRTGANGNTITVEAAEGVYASIKVTLHKENYNLDEDIEQFEAYDVKRIEREEMLEKRAMYKQRELDRAAEKREARLAVREQKKQKRLEEYEKLKEKVENS